MKNRGYVDSGSCDTASPPAPGLWPVIIERHGTGGFVRPTIHREDCSGEILGGKCVSQPPGLILIIFTPGYNIIKS